MNFNLMDRGTERVKCKMKKSKSLHVKCKVFNIYEKTKDEFFVFFTDKLLFSILCCLFLCNGVSQFCENSSWRSVSL